MPTALELNVRFKRIISGGQFGRPCSIGCEKPIKAPQKFEYMESICRNDVHTVAMKSIRFQNITKIEGLLQENKNLKVIVAVRDPRSTFRSRKSLFLHQSSEKEKHNSIALRNLFDRMREDCDENREFSRFVEKSSRDLLNRVLFVRYEVGFHKIEQKLRYEIARLFN